jgi:uncharacterized membrane protein
MRGLLGKVLIAAVALLYPVLVFVGLVFYKAPPRIISLCLLCVLILQFLSTSGKPEGKGSKGTRKAAIAIAASILCIAAFISNSEWVLKLYPIAVSAILLGAFSVTLARPPSMILRFAMLQDKTLKDSPDFDKATAYCQKVTLVWCGFFLCNGAIAVYTTFYASSFAWSLYNGLISYILMGILFAGEMVVRRITQKK